MLRDQGFLTPRRLLPNFIFCLPLYFVLSGALRSVFTLRSMRPLSYMCRALIHAATAFNRNSIGNNKVFTKPHNYSDILRAIYTFVFAQTVLV